MALTIVPIIEPLKVTDANKVWAAPTWAFKTFGYDVKAFSDAVAKAAVSMAALMPVLPPMTEEQLELFPDRVELDVTDVDIRDGIRESNSDCAVARAVARRWDGASVSVGSNTVAINYEGRSVHYHDPSGGLSAFIAVFDRGGPWVPKPSTISLARCGCILI